MTKIKSHFGKTLTIEPHKTDDSRVLVSCSTTVSGYYDRAELHAALGIDELGCGCDEADDNLKKALARAEEAEAEALEQAKLVRTWADRAEKAEAERDHLAATIERVRDVMNEFYKVRGDWHSWTGANALKASLESALDPKPAFVLPTRVPARIEAKRDYHGWAGELELWSNGEQQRFWRCEYDGQDYTPDGVMALFTEHRLVEPES